MVQFGAKNSKYFHRRANARKKINRIEALKNADGDWVFDVDELKNMAVNFYTKENTNKEKTKTYKTKKY